MLNDTSVAKRPRAIDRRWFYEGVVPLSVAGFNPFQSTIYYGARSAMADWLAAPAESARNFNTGDFLVKEVLFAVHDYLHIWGYRLIASLAPQLNLLAAPITRQNLEQLAFCHILTEAIATVGLDYWYLSTFDLNERVPIGTGRSTLTVEYHERFADEYRRFNPELVVQTPAFFDQLARFYCNGIFEGYDVEDYRRSPLIANWLRHELTYAVSQRSYIRQWLSYLSTETIALPAQTFAAPIRCDQPWQIELIEAIGQRLWRKVKLDQRDPLPPAVGRTWASPLGRPVDFRFVNLNCVTPEELRQRRATALSAQDLSFWMYQQLSAFDYDHCARAIVPVLSREVTPAELQLVEHLSRSWKRIPSVGDEPRDLMILN
jgi:hypothetical protein